MKGKTILITGSTDGVGRRVATKLAALGAVVLLHGRDRSRAEQVLAEIQGAGGTATFYLADLSDLRAVRDLAQTVQRHHGRLDILINNAGIAVSAQGSRQSSADGYELRFAVNYLAGFVLTHLLLPTLIASRPARIINVVSVGQQSIDFDDVMLTTGYSDMRAYCQSKLAQVMFTFDLAQELDKENVTANCIHPASYMDTAMVRAAGISPMSTVEEGANAIVRLAASAELAGKSGIFLDRDRPAVADPQAYDASAREQLRVLSLQLASMSESARQASLQG